MSRAIKEMDFEVLKKQIGKDIMRSLDSFEEKGQRAMLKNGNKKAEIVRTLMDLYSVKLIENGEIREVKDDIYFDQLRTVLNNHFSFSLLQAKRNNDEEREKEIMEKAKDGETVRLL